MLRLLQYVFLQALQQRLSLPPFSSLVLTVWALERICGHFCFKSFGGGGGQEIILWTVSSEVWNLGVSAHACRALICCFIIIVSVMHLFLWQGVFEVASGLGYTIGPPLGGFLYAVEYLYCLYYCCTVVSVGVRVWWDLNSSVYTTSDVYSVFTIYSVFTRLVDSSCPSLLWVEQC